MVGVDSQYLFAHGFHGVFAGLVEHGGIKLQDRVAVDHGLFLEELFVAFFPVIDEV